MTANEFLDRELPSFKVQIDYSHMYDMYIHVELLSVHAYTEN